MSDRRFVRRTLLGAFLVVLATYLLALTGHRLSALWRLAPPGERIAAWLRPRADRALTWETTDTNRQWDWQWSAEECRQIWAQWIAEQTTLRPLRKIRLRLIDPEEHALGLPIQAAFPEAHAAPGRAGAWCEAERGQSAALDCAVAPLGPGQPAHVTTALMGAAAQAVRYALDPRPFGAGPEPVWTWAQWQPLLAPSLRAGGWRSACPDLASVS